jgi:hypothetical protein
MLWVSRGTLIAAAVGLLVIVVRWLGGNPQVPHCISRCDGDGSGVVTPFVRWANRSDGPVSEPYQPGLRDGRPGLELVVFGDFVLQTTACRIHRPIRGW